MRGAVYALSVVPPKLTLRSLPLLQQRATASHSQRSDMATAASRRQPPPPAAARTALDEMGKGGEFRRKDSAFRSWIKKGGEFEPEGLI